MRDPSEVIAEMRAQAERSIGAGGLAYELCVLLRAWADRLEAANMPPAISAAMQCVGTLGASLSTPQPASAEVDDAMVERVCRQQAELDAAFAAARSAGMTYDSTDGDQ